MKSFSMIRFHALAPWIAASLCVMLVDLLLPPIAAVCSLQVVLQLAAFRWLAARRAVTLTLILMIATTLPGFVGLVFHLPSSSRTTLPTAFFFEPLRIWVTIALGVAMLFHADLQRVRKRRLRLRQQLQRKVRRRSAQVRRINDALRREVARRQATQQRLTRTETHLQSLAQRMQLQVLRKDTDGVITYANDAFCKNIGRTVDDVIGSTDADLYPATTAEKYRSDDSQVMTSGIPVDHVESHPTADGKTGWVQVFKAPEYDHNDRCIGIQMVFWDVTDTYWRTAELRRSEARKRALFDAAREAVMLVDDQGRVVEANPAAESLLGRGTASVAGCLIESVAVPDSPLFTNSADELQDMPPAPESATERPWAKRLPMRWQEIPTSERREMTIRRYDGTTFPAEISVHPIPLESSQGLAVFIRDVTLRHQAIRALRDAKQAAEEASRTKSEFMAGVSHEIRTPLGGITGSAELLSRMDLSPRAKQYVSMIRQSGELLSGVIGDILDFASIEAGRLQMDPEPTHLHQCVGEAFRCLATRAAGKDIEMVLSISADVPRVVMVDPKRLRQIVINLAGNAIKFTPRGHVLLRITTQAPTPALAFKGSGRQSPPEPMAPMIVIELVDSGIGIANELQDKIFQPFEQGDSGTTRRYGGTGLGLSISKQLVAQMEGRIEVVSRLGHGSTFRCILPLATISGPSPSSNFEKGITKSVALEISHPVQRRAITDLLIAKGFRVDREAMVKIVDHNTTANREQTQDLDRKSTLAEFEPRVIWLARVDDLTGMVDDENEVVLLKPVMPDDLMNAIEFATAATLSDWIATPSRSTKRSEQTSANVNAPSFIQSPATTQLPSQPQDSRVLVVDDSEVNRTVIRDFLTMAGYCADIVDCGAAAVTAADKVQYDCILMDLQMPEMDGVETMQMIHDRSRNRGVKPPPTIALTAHATEDHQSRCLKAGMKSFLVKPIEPAKLIEVVKEFANAANPPEPKPLQTSKTFMQEVGNDNWKTQLLACSGGDPNTMQALAEAFVVEVPQLCQSLRDSIASSNMKEVRRAAHTLKSCLKYVAPAADWQSFADIETAAQAQNLDSVTQLIPTAITTANAWARRVSTLITAKTNVPKK